MPVELAGIPLPHLTRIATTEDARVVRHAVPGMSGDLAQALGRPSVGVELAGILYGPGGASDLDIIRKAHQAGDAVSLFVEPVDDSEATQTLHFSDVLIAGLRVEQRAGAPDEFGFACRLMEYVPPPPPAAGPGGALGALDAELLGDAMAAMDALQSALDAISKLSDLLGSAGDFADPTTRLPAMLTTFADAAANATSLLSDLRGTFDAPA